MAKVDREPGVLEYLFKPKVLSVPSHPDQEWTSTQNYRDARDLASRLVLLSFFGVARPILDSEFKNPIFDILGYIVAAGFISTTVDLVATSIKLKVAERNFKKDWKRLHPDR